MNVQTGDFVLPGDLIGVVEEFIPSDGVYGDDDGDIKSLIVGKVSIDEKNKRVFVIPEAGFPPALKRNTTILGQVTEVKGQKALVKIHGIKGNSRQLQVSFIGSIHISQVQKSYLARLTDVFHIGDIIEAKVTKVMGLDAVDLKTSQKDLGVVKAMCTRCRHYMFQSGRTEVKCPNCGHRERRKLSINYQA